jgi:hypothetical protein
MLKNKGELEMNLTDLEKLLVKHLYNCSGYQEAKCFRFDCEIYPTEGRYSQANVEGADLMVGQWKGVFGSLEKKGIIELCEYLNDKLNMPIYMFTYNAEKKIKEWA